MFDRRSLLEALDAQTTSKFEHTRRLQMERENWSWTNPSLWRAQKNNYKIFCTNLFVVEFVLACFQHFFYSGWILKSYKPKPPAIWIQKQKSHHHYVAYCIFFRHAIYNTKLIAFAVWAGRKKRCFISSLSIYLDCLVFGSIIIKHSFKSPYLLKYADIPSETDEKWTVTEPWT